MGPGQIAAAACSDHQGTTGALVGPRCNTTNHGFSCLEGQLIGASPPLRATQQ
jgi:hypothetical protein